MTEHIDHGKFCYHVHRKSVGYYLTNRTHQQGETYSCPANTEERVNIKHTKRNKLQTSNRTRIN